MWSTLTYLTYGRNKCEVSVTITHTECPGFVKRRDCLDQMGSNGLYSENLVSVGRKLAEGKYLALKEIN